VFVTFLNIQADPDAWINGALIPVHESALESIDRRERNYDRRDVTAALDADLDGPVWAYLGSDDGRGRYEAGRAGGTAVVSSEYLSGVEADFSALGAGMLELFRLTTDPPQAPLVPLERVEL